MKILDMKKMVTKIKNFVDWIHKQIQRRKKKSMYWKRIQKKVHKLKLRVKKKVRK